MPASAPAEASGSGASASVRSMPCRSCGPGARRVVSSTSRRSGGRRRKAISTCCEASSAQCQSSMNSSSGCCSASAASSEPRLRHRLCDGRHGRRLKAAQQLHEGLQRLGAERFVAMRAQYAPALRFGVVGQGLGEPGLAQAGLRRRWRRCACSPGPPRPGLRRAAAVRPGGRPGRPTPPWLRRRSPASAASPSTRTTVTGSSRPRSSTVCGAALRKWLIAGPSVSTLTTISSACALSARRAAMFGTEPVSSKRPRSMSPDWTSTRPPWMPECRRRSKPAGKAAGIVRAWACKASVADTARRASSSCVRG